MEMRWNDLHTKHMGLSDWKCAKSCGSILDCSGVNAKNQSAANFDPLGPPELKLHNQVKTKQISCQLTTN